MTNDDARPLEARSAAVEAELDRLPFRPGAAGSFKWWIDPVGATVADAMIATGHALKNTLTPDELRRCGPRTLITVNLDKAEAYVPFERIDREQR